MKMDFLVSGVPRSGTTTVANVINRHPDAVCYSAESHLLAFLMECAPDAPLPRQNLASALTIFLEQNRQVLLEMVNYNIARRRPKKWLIFDEESIRSYSIAVIDLLDAGYFGAELCSRALDILAGYLGRHFGTAIIGEKTPSNIFAVRKFGSMGLRHHVSVIREPFAVIRSMRARASHAEDIYASDFHGGLEHNIGLYLEYANAVTAVLELPCNHLFRYEDLLERPHYEAARLHACVGLIPNEAALDVAVQRLRIVTPGDASTSFRPSEIARIWHLTAAVRSRFDYGNYSDPGLSRIPDVQFDHSSLVVVSGFHEPQAQGQSASMMSEGVIAVYARTGSIQLDMTFWSHFPEELADQAQVARLDITSNESRLGAVEAPIGRAVMSAVTVRLGECIPVCTSASGSVYLLALKSSIAFRRSTLDISAQDAAANPLRDRRLLSFSLFSAAIDGVGVLG